MVLGGGLEWTVSGDKALIIYIVEFMENSIELACTDPVRERTNASEIIQSGERFVQNNKVDSGVGLADYHRWGENKNLWADHHLPPYYELLERKRGGSS